MNLKSGKGMYSVVLISRDCYVLSVKVAPLTTPFSGEISDVLEKFSAWTFFSTIIN